MNFPLSLLQKAAVAAPAAAKLKKATQDLEAIFVKDLLSAMRKTVQKQPLGKSMGAEMYDDMLDQALAESASKSGTLGIAKVVYRQMAPLAIATAIAQAEAQWRANANELKSDAGRDARPASGRDDRAPAKETTSAPKPGAKTL